MSMSMDTSDDGGYSKGSSKEPRWDKDIKWWSWPDDGQPYDYRLVAQPVYFYNHWVQTIKRDKSPGKPFAILCKNYDSKENKFVKNGCKACEYYSKVQQELGDLDWDKYPARIRKLGAARTMAQNMIVRDLQRQGPPSNSVGKWTFIQPGKFPNGLSKELVLLAEKFNKSKEDPTKSFYFNHRTNGKDLMIAYNGSEKDPKKMYMVQAGSAYMPLSEEELAHSEFLTDFLKFLSYPSDETVEEALQKNGYYEYLKGLVASKNMQQVQMQMQNQPTQPAQQAAQPTPPTEPITPTGAITDTQKAANIAAFDTEEKPAPAEPEPARPAAPAQPATPVAAASQQPVQPVASTQPPAQPTQPAAQASDTIEGKLKDFSGKTGVLLKPHEKAYSQMRNYTTGMTVPDCFSQYGQKDIKICKQCPIKLDCMMTGTD